MSLKSRHVLASLLAVAVASNLSPPALAAQNKQAQPPAQTENIPEWAELFGGASLPVIWQSASAASDEIAGALATNKLAGVAAWAETVHLASHALQDQVKLSDPEKQKRLDGALSQAAKIADDVLDGANHNEPENASAAFQRLKSALSLVRLRLPKEIIDAPAQEVRFAKSASHAHDEKHEPTQKK